MRYSRRGALSRAFILTQAVEIAAAEGLEAVTFERLATELHRSRSGIFEHFPGKERLRAAVIDFAADRFDKIVLAPSRARGGASGLRLMLECWLDHTVTPEGLVLARAAVSEWDDDEFRPFRALGNLQMHIIEGRILFGVNFGQIKRDVNQAKLALDLYVLGSGCAAALLALGGGVRERLEEKIEARFAEFLTPEGAKDVAAEMDFIRRCREERDW